MIVNSDGEADATFLAGDADIESGGVASGTIVSNGATETVLGGKTVGATVLSGGTEVLFSGAIVSGLNVEAGTPALQVQRTYSTSDGQVAQVTINTHPASRFRHSMTMRRMKG